MTDQTADALITEATMADTLQRLEDKIDAVMAALDTRPTRDEMTTAIETKASVVKADVVELVAQQPSLEQVQVIADNSIRPVIATVDKLVSGFAQSGKVHDQSMQRIERLYQIASANTAAVQNQERDITALEADKRKHDQALAIIKAETDSVRQKQDELWKTVMPHNGDGGMLVQMQTMHATVDTIQGDLEAVKTTSEDLDKHRARQVRREEALRNFIHSRKGLSLAAAGFGTVFGNWLGLIDIDIDNIGEVIGLAIKLLI